MHVHIYMCIYMICIDNSQYISITKLCFEGSFLVISNWQAPRAGPSRLLQTEFSPGSPSPLSSSHIPEQHVLRQQSLKLNLSFREGPINELIDT